MSVRLKLFLFVIWILVLVYLFFKLKSRKADIKYILPWILLDAGMMVITAFPGILTFFCNLFGIETPSNMLFFFGLVFLAMIAFSMTLVISKQHAQIRDLTQRMALYEEREAEGTEVTDGPKEKADEA